MRGCMKPAVEIDLLPYSFRTFALRFERFAPIWIGVPGAEPLQDEAI
jgi:hypothetical protein